MDGLLVCKHFYNSLLITPPQATFTATVASSNTKMVIFEEELPGGQNAWAHCLMKVDIADEPALPGRYVIQASAGNTVTLFNNVPKYLTFEPGSTVELVGGPLADAAVFLFEPTSIEQVVASGKTAWVIVNREGQRLGYAGIRAKSVMDNGANNKEREHKLLISGETVSYYGSATPLTDIEIYDAKLATHILEEQIISVVHSTRLDTCNGMYSTEDVYSQNNIQLKRDGGLLTIGCMVSFDVTFRK